MSRNTIPAAKTLFGLVGPLLLLFMVGAMSGCREEAPENTGETPRNVRVLELAPDSLAEYFEITGPVTPVRGTDISAQESGPVVKIMVKKGEAIKAGRSILKLERNLLEADMESARMALKTEEYNLDKVQQLFDAGKLSRIELLNSQSSHQAAKSRAAISEERFQRAQIKAPFDCVLADRYVELGQMVMPGQPVVRCIDPFTLKLEGYLTGTQIGWAEVGTPAAVILGDRSMPASGTISWVGLEADRNTGKFKVEVEIPNPDLDLRSGVIGRARIEKNISRDVVTIPRDAVMEGRHGPEVFTVVAERARRIPITLGPDQGPMVIVTGGLVAGDLLVVRGHRELVDNSLVKVTEKSAAKDGSIESDPQVTGGNGSGASQ